MPSARVTSSVAHTGKADFLHQKLPTRPANTRSRTWFNDLDSLPTAFTGQNKPSKISLRGAERLDSVGLTVASGKSYTHGGTGGQLSELPLAANEYWTKAKLCQGQYRGHTRNFYLLATTSSGRTVSAGTATSDCKEFAAAPGWQIVGFYGQDGDAR